MGPVNLRAKTEEKIISQSIDELEMEKLDLTQAIDKLRLAINKINNEGKNRLLKAYEDVNKNFSELLKNYSMVEKPNLSLSKLTIHSKQALRFTRDHLEKNCHLSACCLVEKKHSQQFL